MLVYSAIGIKMKSHGPHPRQAMIQFSYLLLNDSNSLLKILPLREHSLNKTILSSILMEKN